jgi:hypothetical protein
VHISYIAFAGSGNAGLIKYATNTSSAWATFTVDSSSDINNIYECAIAVTGTDTPIVYMSYYFRTDTYTYEKKYATNISGSWENYVIDVDSYFGQSAIAIDSNNKVHIVYPGPEGLKYATNMTGAWIIKTISTEACFSLSVAIDSKNKLHISYLTGGDWGISPLKYATNASGTWVFDSIEQESDDFRSGLPMAGSSTAIAVDHNDKIHISYYESYNYLSSVYNLKYATNSSGDWIRMKVEELTVPVGASSTSIAIDYNNKPHISYEDATNRKLKYATPLGE